MNTLPLLRGTSLLLALSVFALTSRVEAQQFAQAGKENIVTHIIPTPTPLETLQQRVAQLEQEVTALKGVNKPTGPRLGPLTRLSRDSKGDAAAVTQKDILLLWNKVDQIIQRLNELAARQ